MKRYDNNKIKIDKDGKRVYTTTYYPPIPLTNSDQFIQTKVGTRLDNLILSILW